MKKCGQCSKPAVLHITELQDSQVNAVHLCEACAKQYLAKPPHDSSSDSGEEAAESVAEDDASSDDAIDMVCPNCGITFKEFRAHGRLGCAHDYVAFQSELTPLLENIHSELEHCGKRPKRSPQAARRQYELVRLRHDLKSAVDEERYEEAAHLRDQIRRAESSGEPVVE